MRFDRQSPWNDAARELLRRGDPAAALAPSERSERVAAGLAATRERERLVNGHAFRVPGLVLATALLVALSAGYAGRSLVEKRPSPPPSDPGGQIALARPSREIYFETAGGTRVVWVLAPTSPY